jgi:hypothetical protein
MSTDTQQLSMAENVKTRESTSNCHGNQQQETAATLKRSVMVFRLIALAMLSISIES